MQVCTTERFSRILQNAALGHNEQGDRDSKHHQQRSCKLEYSTGIQPFVRHAWQYRQVFKLPQQGFQLLWDEGSEQGLIDVRYELAGKHSC